MTPFLPFFFVIVAEGLTGLVKKVMAVGNYTGLNIISECIIEILQFTDDALMVNEASWKQVWALNGVLMVFSWFQDWGSIFSKPN